MANGKTKTSIIKEISGVSNNKIAKVSLGVKITPKELNKKTEIYSVKENIEKNKTTIICNSDNLLITDIISNGIYYFYKIYKEKEIQGLSYIDSNETVEYIEDIDYLYLINNKIIEINYTDSTIDLIKPMPIYLNEYFDLGNQYTKDNKKYSLKKYHNKIKITINNTGLYIKEKDQLISIEAYSNNIFLNSFIFDTQNSFLLSNRKIEEINIDKFKLTEFSLNTYKKSKEITTRNIYVENIIEINDTVFYIKIFLNNGLLENIQYNLYGEIVFNNTTTGSILVTEAKVSKLSEEIFCEIEKEKLIQLKRFVGKERLVRFLGENFLLYKDNTYISGDIIKGIKIFNINKLNTNYIPSNFFTIDNTGNLIDSIIVDGNIYNKSNLPIGIGYENRNPGIFL